MWTVGFAILYGILRVVVGWTYRIPKQGQCLVRSGGAGIAIASTSGIFKFPVIHRLELMDISLKEVVIHRHGSTGLICKDNLRADISVTFYVRVNSANIENVKHVAQTIGCERASDPAVLAELFEPKFSDGLKTAGREFNFEELLDKRKEFRDAIVNAVGTDLNGFTLDDAAIDLLEQTKVELLDPENILDADGIKRITERTATQAIITNEHNRNRERDINQKDVETREMILEQNKQLAEAEEKQKREVSSIKAREEAETVRVQQEERQKAEKARIATDEEVQVAEENKQRQIIVAMRNKERTDGVEQVRVEKDRQLEDIERDRVVTLTDIEKQKAVEIEQKNIQEVIRERVMVQKDVVTEEQRIKDVEAFATVERSKRVAVTEAEAAAETAVVKEVKAAEAAKQAAELKADQNIYVQVKDAEAQKQASELIAEKVVIEAEGKQNASLKLAEGKIALASGVTAEAAAPGLAEAQVEEAKAVALEKTGTAEANVMRSKFTADADGIHSKAEAMKLFNEAGKEHEEFKINAEIRKEVTLADISNRKDIADAQASVLGAALKTAKVDIVGGDAVFFDRIVNAITTGKSVDRTIGNSNVLSDVKGTFFNSDPEYFRSQVKHWVDRFGLSSEDLKNLSVAAALGKMASIADSGDVRAGLSSLRNQADQAGIGGNLIDEFLRKDS